jgi:glucose/arabinose dehydrogenase
MAGLRSRAGLIVAAAILAAALILAFAGRGAGSRADAGVPVGVALDQIGSFNSPVYVDNAPHRRKLLFVVEQPGAVRVLRNGHKLSKPFLEISDRVQYGGEEGLLSVAFDPKYKKNRRFFVYYTNNHGDNEVDRFKARKKNPLRAKTKSRRKVIELPHPGQANHNGGQLQFGPDRFLYLAPGDGGGSGDPNENAQNKNSLLGKLLRIEPKRKRGHRSPSSNPFANSTGKDEIYSLGLRNPYRFSFDSATGDVFIGDVGQDEREEIDHESLAGAKGANFGWDIFEGNSVFEGGGAPPNYQPPVLDYSSGTGSGNCAVTGGYVVHDATLPSLAGRYVYADFCGGQIRSFDPDAPGATDAATGLSVASPSSFGEGVRGKIYVTSLSGPVYRISG